MKTDDEFAKKWEKREAERHEQYQKVKALVKDLVKTLNV